MKHDKKRKKNKSTKRNKKSKKSDRKEKKQKSKEKKKRDKKLEKTLKTVKETQTITPISKSNDNEDAYCGPSIDLMNRAKCPETKAEYDHRQNQIKRVVDTETGRVRLIKGDGEILEEIVSRERHKWINQEATRNDGQTFQKNTIGSSRKLTN